MHNIAMNKWQVTNRQGPESTITSEVFTVKHFKLPFVLLYLDFVTYCSKLKDKLIIARAKLTATHKLVIIKIIVLRGMAKKPLP